MLEHSFHIRPANVGDVAIITDYNIALCRETEGADLDQQTVIQGVSRFIAEPHRGRYWVAVNGSEVIGQTAHTHEWSDWRNGEFWWLESVYVHPHHRGRGVFRSLYQHIKALADRDPDCCGLRLYLERNNADARRSYLRLGFKETAYEVLEAGWNNPL